MRLLLPRILLATFGLVAAAASAAEPVRIVGHTLTGGIDPPDRLESLVRLLAPVGSFHVPAGPVDTVVDTPVSTEGRLRQALERLGYHPQIVARSTAGGLHLDIQLRPADRVRHIFVDGNWPFRQEDIIRRLTIRAGQALPPPGPELSERLERERQSVLGFLWDEGYLEAQVRIEVQRRSPAPAPVNLYVRINEGLGYPLGEVKVSGNKALSTDTIVKKLKHYRWYAPWLPEPFRLRQLRADVIKLHEQYRELGYAAARLTTDYDPERSIDPRTRQVRLGLSVLERKRVELLFEGNERFDDEDLKDVVTLFERGSYDNYEAEASAAAIAQLYRSKGHPFVKVTWTGDGSHPEIHRIQFRIHEGPHLKVRGVDFQGNQAFSDGRLADVVTVKTFPLLGRLGIGEGGYASFRQLELDVERLAVFYRALGFPDARVRAEIGPRRDRWQPLGSVSEQDPAWKTADALHVRFQVEEGARVDIGQVRFETAPGQGLPYPAEFLAEAIDGKVGEPFRPEVVRSDENRLRRLLGDAGYPGAVVTSTATRRGNRMDILWQVELGDQRRAGPLFVRGNFQTAERTIRNWMLLRPGKLITTTDQERSQRNLALIQLFNNASPLSFPPELQVGDTYPMLVEVEERHDHWGVARAGVGASTEQREPGELVGVYGTIGYEHRNLLGQGWLFSSRGEYGNQNTEVSAQFIDPRFLGTQFRLQLTGFYSREATARLGDIRQGSGTIGFAREMYPGLDASLTYGWRRITRTEFLLRGAGPDAEQETVSIATTVGSLRLAVEWQRLDNPLVPTRGLRLQGAVELASPPLSFRVGEDTFVKTSLRSLSVLPLGERLGLRHSIRYDHGFALGGASLLPKVERFFAGGDTTLRGFDLDRARIETLTGDLAPLTPVIQHRPLGGSLRVLHNLDLQFQIAGSWYAAVFVDSGVVADSFDGMVPADFRHGAGVAPLVLKLPIGDVSLAYAWPLDPQPGDPKYGRLHLNVGLMF